MTERDRPYRDRSRVLALVGVLLLIVGVAFAVLAPAESTCFYLFGEGGRFHYPGFGFGSLVFALIAWQVIGYYAIALICIPLGYGHLRRRRWARVLVVSLLWCWLVVGVPLMVVFLLLLSFKELSPSAAVLVVGALGMGYLIAPGLLIRFYQSRNVRETFEARDPNSYWVESLPMPVLVLAALLIFYVVVLHVPLFFNGIFPLFGIWLSDIQGALALAVSIFTLACLTWGVLRQRTWAWWGSLAHLSLLTASSVVTLARSTLTEMAALVRLPPREMQILAGVPLEGAHLAPFIGIPLVITLVLIVLSKRQLKRRE